jgi:hypothetical protein
MRDLHKLLGLRSRFYSVMRNESAALDVTSRRVFKMA